MDIGTRTVICDNGSGFIKAAVNIDGLETHFPNIIGRYRHQVPPLSKPYVGERAIHNHMVMNLVSPIKRGVITDFVGMESVWEHIFTNELDIDPTECDLIITEPANNHYQQTRRMVEKMFEKFEFPSILVARQPVLSMYSVNQLTGVAVEVGHDLTQVLPVNDGHSVDECLAIREFGGSDITDELARLLGEKKHELTMAHQRREINEIKETCGYVASDYEAEEKTVEEQKYYLPDGTPLVLAKEKCQCTELLFKVNGRVDNGIDNLIIKALYLSPTLATDVNLQKTLASNIILGGGSTLFPGLALRVKKTMEDFVGGTVAVYEGGGPRSAIIGGRVLAQLPDFGERLTTKMEYDEAGMDEILRKRI